MTRMASTGIPSIERFVARFIIRRWTSAHPPEFAASLLRTQHRELVVLKRDAGIAATERVQIERPRGLEQSSSNYSLVMVADHRAREPRLGGHACGPRPGKTVAPCGIDLEVQARSRVRG